MLYCQSETPTCQGRWSALPEDDEWPDQADGAAKVRRHLFERHVEPTPQRARSRRLAAWAAGTRRMRPGHHQWPPTLRRGAAPPSTQVPDVLDLSS